MKKYSILFLVFCVAMISLSFVPANTSTPLSFCAALDTVMKETAVQYEGLKGALTSTDDDGAQNHELKIAFPEWTYNEYVKAGSDISVDIRSEMLPKAKALELFNNTAKQITACIGIDGQSLTAASIEKIMLFTKDNTDIGLMLGTVKGKSFVAITISKAE